MDSEQFDTIAMRVAGCTSRRGILGAALGALVTASGASEGSAGQHHNHYYHHHQHKRCTNLGGACIVSRRGACCSKQCGTHGIVAGKCCIPKGEPCTSAGDCCDGVFGCENPQGAPLCS
jgi:hypothetical protein